MASMVAPRLRSGRKKKRLSAFETVAAEATAQGKRLADHLAHLVVHGVLHLIGFDHEAAAEAARMEALETGILAGLGIADPYRAREATHG